MTGTLPRRRLGRLLSGAAAFLLAPTAILAAAVAVLVGAPSAAAETAVTTISPFTFAGDNPCTGEAFSGTGALHMLVGGTLSGGGTAQSHTEANLQGLKATTLLGKKYVVVDTSNHTIVFDTPDLMPFHEELEWTVQFVRQAEDGSLIMGDDFYEHILAHVTVNANGVVTVDDFTDDQRCK
jgi:hypothetical protein